MDEDLDVFAAFRYTPAKRARSCQIDDDATLMADRLSIYIDALDDMHFVAIDGKNIDNAIHSISFIIATHAGLVEHEYNQRLNHSNCQNELSFIFALMQTAQKHGCELVAHDASRLNELLISTASKCRTDAKPNLVTTDTPSTDTFLVSNDINGPFCTMRNSRLRCGFASQNKVKASSSHCVYQFLYGQPPPENINEAMITAHIFVEGRARGWW